jgi:hypothetical protein
LADKIFAEIECCVACVESHLVEGTDAKGAVTGRCTGNGDVEVQNRRIREVETIVPGVGYQRAFKRNGPDGRRAIASIGKIESDR